MMSFSPTLTPSFITSDFMLLAVHAVRMQPPEYQKLRKTPPTRKAVMKRGERVFETKGSKHWF
jgi:hypothetical protein